MRLAGMTYGEIKNAFGISKSTLSNWFSKISLSQKARQNILEKSSKNYYKLTEFNKRRTLAIEAENEKIRSGYEKRIRKLSERDLMLIGGALYWGS